jgi:hypothetical protein
MRTPHGMARQLDPHTPRRQTTSRLTPLPTNRQRRRIQHHPMDRSTPPPTRHGETPATGSRTTRRRGAAGELGPGRLLSLSLSLSLTLSTVLTLGAKGATIINARPALRVDKLKLTRYRSRWRTTAPRLEKLNMYPLKVIIEVFRSPGGWSAHILDNGPLEDVGPLPLPLTDAASAPDAVSHMQRAYPTARILTTGPRA